MGGYRWFRKEQAFRNLEGFVSYDFSLARSRTRPGVSAMVRVKNESGKIGHCLKSILPVFDEIVIVDNASDDQTVDIVERIRRESDAPDRIRLLSYPHRLARFGPEHRDTPENSVHSAVYYTNWTLSHCAFRYVCKWDGDMVLARNVRADFRNFLRGIQQGAPKCWVLAGQTVYRDTRGDFYLAKGEVNREIEIFPYGFRCSFRKEPNWERLTRPLLMSKGEFEPVCFYELKFVDEDEFSHWSTTRWPSRRKQREWDNYSRIRNGETDPGRFERLGPRFLDQEVADAQPDAD